MIWKNCWRRRGVRSLTVAALMALLTSCRLPGEKQDLNKLTEEFIYSSLALAPVTATGVGYHVHNGRRLDEFLDDYSFGGIREQHRFYASFSDRLERIQPETLSAEDRADYRILKNQVALGLLELTTLRSFRHNPTVYVELIGNALFGPYVLEYGAKADRYRHIIKRLIGVPVLLDQAKANLQDSPDVWNKVAREEDEGNVALIDKTMRANVPPELKAEYDRAAGPALDAIRKFDDYLAKDLSQRVSSWRLGKDKYALKFRDTLDIGKTPDEVLADAEAELKHVREEMVRLAAPKPLAQALDEIARQHATPETYFEAARQDLQQATDFVRAKHLLSLPARQNLQVIPTPEFMRGVYGVGGFNPAPALEPALGAFYWITPISPAWPKERVESKLREYNVYGLHQLTIHEAMPGHYVQAEFANDVQPKPRRLLRNVYGNGAYVEGWAVYCQQLMSDEGFLNNNPALKLSFLKQMLRVISNSILDIRLQTMNMSDQEALDLMLRDTFQEHEEATAKLQRAQLTSGQLPMYFVGWRGWLQARDEYKKRAGDKFELWKFHDAALKESAVPLPVLGELLK
jgi:uncharacterized protein (DUF885 family)